jgi:hypothetical protein
MRDGLVIYSTLKEFQFFSRLMNSELFGENISGKLENTQRKF